MFTVKRSATAGAALAVLLTACGGTDGDATTTSDPAAGDESTTEPAEPRTPSPEPTDPDTDASPPPAETPEPRETPSEPPRGDGSDEEKPPPDTAEPEPDQAATKLTVRLDPGTGGEVQEWTVTCDPVGGTMGNPEAACETLEEISPRDVAPVPRDAHCTMQYGGPQTATVTGHWDGERVNLSFSRQNGCEINRWDTMDPVLPASDGAQL